MRCLSLTDFAKSSPQILALVENTSHRTQEGAGRDKYAVLLGVKEGKEILQVFNN